MPLQELHQNDFSGGLNAVANPFLLNKNQVFRSRNLLLDEHGSLVTRPGSAIRPSTGPGGGPIVYLDTLTTLAGQIIPFAVVRPSVGGNIIYRIDTTPWTQLGTATTAFQIPQATTVLGQQVIALGYETPFLWDGLVFTRMTALAGQTVPPGAQHLALHREALWVWNTNPVTTTLDGDSSLRMSNFNNPNDWPSLNQTFISRGDGTQGRGLATFTIAETGISPTASMIAFKDRSAYQVTGTLSGGTGFTVQKLKSDMGCIAPRSIQFVAGYGIIRLTHKGFALFNGVDDRLISEEVRPYIFGHDDVAGIDFANVAQSWASQVFNPPLYICGCPQMHGASALDRFFVYDLVRRAWSICDFPTLFGSITNLTLAGQQPEVWAGSSTGVNLYRLFSPLDIPDSTGAAVPWSMVSRRFGDSAKMQYWRRMILGLAYTPLQSVVAQAITGSGRAVGRALTYQGGVTATDTATFVYGSAQYGLALYAPSPLGSYSYTTDPAQYGSATYGFPSANAGAESLDIQDTAPWVDVKIQGAGPVRIRELSLHASPKPLRRLTTAGAL